METSQMLDYIDTAGTIGLSIGVLILMVKGILVPQSVIRSIVADTAKEVLERLQCPLVDTQKPQ